MPLKTNTPEQREAYRIYMREYHKKKYKNDDEYKRKHIERVKARQAIKKAEKQQENIEMKLEAEEPYNINIDDVDFDERYDEADREFKENLQKIREAHAEEDFSY